MVVEVLLGTLLDLVMAFFIVIGWGILFNTPRRVLIVAGLSGSLGHSLRYLFLEGFGASLISSTLVGAVSIGFIGIILARRVDTPPVVFTMPASISMMPGLLAYNSMLGFVKIATTDVAEQSPTLISETAHNFVLTVSLLFCLSIGITIGSLLFRKKTAREVNLNMPLVILPFFNKKNQK